MMRSGFELHYGLFAEVTSSYQPDETIPMCNTVMKYWLGLKFTPDQKWNSNMPFFLLKMLEK